MSGILIILAGILAVAACARRERSRGAMVLPERGKLHRHDGPMFGGTFGTPEQALAHLDLMVGLLCEHRAMCARPSPESE